MGRLKREIKELKTQNEDLKAELEKKAQFHEAIITDIKSKDQAITGY